MANNSSGARSVLYGKTIDHVLEQVVVLSDGSVVHFRDIPRSEVPAGDALEASLDAGCCGMAGSFGYLQKHFDVSQAIAGRRAPPRGIEASPAQMAERSRQRVRGVRLRRLGQAQLRLHHRGHLLLRGRAAAGHGQLDGARGVLGDLQAALGHRHHERSAHMPQHERRAGVGVVERCLDHHAVGPPALHHLVHLPHDRAQALGERQPRGGRHVARGHAVELARTPLHHAPTGPTTPGIQSQHSHDVAST